MAPARSLATVITADQWLRCSHQDTAVDLSEGTVTLAWQQPAGADWQGSGASDPAGLAFDPAGRLYHGDLATGQVQWIAWRPGDSFTLRGVQAAPVDLLADPETPSFGQFEAVAGRLRPALIPASIAVDFGQHLYVIDGATGAIWVFDLDTRTAFRRVTLSVPATGLASTGPAVLVTVADRNEPLLSLEARRAPVPVAIPPAALKSVSPAALPIAIASSGASLIWTLWRSPAGESWAVPVADERTSAALGPFTWASGIAIDGNGNVVIAGPPTDDFRSFSLDGGISAENAPLEGRNYDGRGIVRTPDGGIGFWTRRGFRIAVAARIIYAQAGHVDVFELDAQHYQQRWGRIFIDACIPDGTTVEVACVTADDEPGGSAVNGSSIPRILPANVDPADPRVPLATPSLVAADLTTALDNTHPLHYREVDSEVPWLRRSSGDPFHTYEGIVNAEPGRYLWIRLVLRGNTRLSPQIRAVRIEYPGTDWMARLPKVFSADPAGADFLFRFLSLPDGVLADIDARAAQRDLLLEPLSAPPEALSWIASLFGLTLDKRWSEASRRQLLSEVICLWRRRGTLGALTRMLEIYLGARPVIFESWRLRAMGSAAPAGRVGTGVAGTGVVGGGLLGGAFEPYAHRFSVVIPRQLDALQLKCVEDLLDRYRPAHTLYDLCTVGAGMRAGLGLHVELTSIVGPSAGWHEAEVGGMRLGADTIIGRPQQGIRPGGSRLGIDSRADT
jgi:phage tail-like protein